MDECVGRSSLWPWSTRRCACRWPTLFCNQTPPVDGKPSLMTFQKSKPSSTNSDTACSMLTTVNYGLASGIRNVEWDAVELPSQFMENWCYHRDTLLGLSGHVDTGEPLPDDLYEKICAARNYRAGSQMLRQLYFAFLDLALHHNFDPHGRETIFQVQERIAKITTVLPPLPEDRFLCSFGHIFSGGYAAGYYSYGGQKCSAPTLLAPSRKRVGGCGGGRQYWSALSRHDPSTGRQPPSYGGLSRVSWS